MGPQKRPRRGVDPSRNRDPRARGVLPSGTPFPAAGRMVAQGGAKGGTGWNLGRGVYSPVGLLFPQRGACGTPFPAAGRMVAHIVVCIVADDVVAVALFDVVGDDVMRRPDNNAERLPIRHEDEKADEPAQPRAPPLRDVRLAAGEWSVDVRRGMPMHTGRGTRTRNKLGPGPDAGSGRQRGTANVPGYQKVNGAWMYGPLLCQQSLGAATLAGSIAKGS
eukprot:gene17331-biopygen13222